MTDGVLEQGGRCIKAVYRSNGAFVTEGIEIKIQTPEPRLVGGGAWVVGCAREDANHRFNL